MMAVGAFLAGVVLVFWLRDYLQNDAYLIPLALGLLLGPRAALALPDFLGDLDETGTLTARDAVLLVDHVSGADPLEASVATYADLNRDGTSDAADVDRCIDSILGQAPPLVFQLPLSTIHASPGNIGARS